MHTTTFAPSSHDVGTARTPGLAAALRARLHRAGLMLWYGLESHGRARALRDLALLQDRREFHEPEYTRHLRDARAFLIAEGARRRD